MRPFLFPMDGDLFSINRFRLGVLVCRSEAYERCLWKSSVLDRMTFQIAEVRQDGTERKGTEESRDWQQWGLNFLLTGVSLEVC
jgi:hypothetical protein